MAAQGRVNNRGREREGEGGREREREREGERGRGSEREGMDIISSLFFYFRIQSIRRRLAKVSQRETVLHHQCSHHCHKYPQSVTKNSNADPSLKKVLLVTKYSNAIK